MDWAEGVEISLPVRFQGPQTSLFGVPAASATAYEQDGWVGDTRRGGSVNFSTLRLTPHCNGTHTEGIGHVVDERVAVAAPVAPIPATLVSIAPLQAAQTVEAYPVLEPQDLLLTRAALAAALENTPAAWGTGVVLRTLPNYPDKPYRPYGAEADAPFFSTEAMLYLVKRGVKHLVVDLPSVDRLRDEGRVANHRIYWRLPATGHDLPPDARREATLTEFAFIPDTLPDGRYLLGLHTPPLETDAVPSRVVLWPVSPVTRG